MCWSPFFLHLLMAPWLTSPLPPALSIAMTLLGYAQCALTPVLAILLVDRMRKMIFYCTC